MTAGSNSNQSVRRCVLYRRVSTKGQADDGVSLDAQRDRLETWADANGYRVIGCHDDAGKSGRRLRNRPGLKAAIGQACDEHATLVVYSVSRLTRSIVEGIQISDRLKRADATLFSLTESLDTTTAAGRLAFHMFLVVAEYDIDVNAERTRFALAHKRANGEKTGGSVPFGYRVDDGRLIEIPEQQEAIRIGLDLHAKGKSYRAIARHLHANGYTDRVMNHKTIAGILRRHQTSPLKPNTTKGVSP